MLKNCGSGKNMSANPWICGPLPDPRRRPHMQVRTPVRYDKPAHIPSSTLRPPLPYYRPFCPPPPPPRRPPPGQNQPRNPKGVAIRPWQGADGQNVATNSNERSHLAVAATMSAQSSSTPPRPQPVAAVRPSLPRPYVTTAVGGFPTPVSSYVTPVIDFNNDFAEFFSNSDDGTTPIPTRILEKCGNAAIHELGSSSEIQVLSRKSTELPYLPFDELIGYYFPEEAADGLQVLFKGREEPGPKYITDRFVIATISVSNHVFQALGSSMEEAKNQAARKAVEYLKSIEQS